MLGGFFAGVVSRKSYGGVLFNGLDKGATALRVTDLNVVNYGVSLVFLLAGRLLLL